MKKLFVILIISLFAITACTTTAEPTGSTEALTLEQNFSAELATGTVSIDYPADWVANAEFVDIGLKIATSAELASSISSGGAIGEGDVYLEILFSPESDLNGDTPSDVIQDIINSINNPDGNISEIEEKTLDGKVAVFVTLDAEDSSDGMFLVIDSGDAYTTIVAVFPDGALATNQATIEAIAGSIEYLLVEEVEMTPEATTESD